MAAQAAGQKAFYDRYDDEYPVIDPERKLKVGIIGTGWIAESHIVNYLKMPDVEIVAGADLVPGKARAFFEKFGVENARCYNSHREMLDSEELDAVSVCTYNASHAECTVYALEKGVHVMLEKPMSVTLDEGIEIMRAEKKSGKIVSIGFQPRLDENMKYIKRIIQEGELGDVYYVRTGGGRRRGIPTPFGTSFIRKETAGVGALGDIGCYSLDMVLNALGNPRPLTVTGYKSNFFGRNPKYANKPEYAEIFSVDDFGAAFIRLEGGIVLDFCIGWAHHVDTPGDTIFFGKEAALRVPSTDGWYGTVGGAMTLYKDVAHEQSEMKLPILTTKLDLFYMKLRTFLNAVKTGGPAPVPTSQIIYNQAIIDGIVKSVELGREIEIAIPEI